MKKIVAIFFLTIITSPISLFAFDWKNHDLSHLAIVTNQPGTTRDLLESFLDISGLPIRFIDTA